MNHKDCPSLSIPYNVYRSLTELPEAEGELVEAALEAAQKAYAPYSGFNVGAAVRLNNGLLITGSNQENAAYPSGLCAERVALFSAAAQYPNQGIIALAVTAIKDGQWIQSPIPPCGSCRQVFVEWEKRFHQPFAVIMAGANKIVRLAESAYLMPFSFDADYL